MWRLPAKVELVEGEHEETWQPTQRLRTLPPHLIKSAVWQHFGYPVEIKDGNCVVDKTHTICRKCFKKLPQVTGNTTNMQMHILRHHPEINLAAAQKTTQQQQPTLPSLFQAKFPANSDRAQKMTNAIAIFMALDMRPFSVVENEGFKYYSVCSSPVIYYQAGRISRKMCYQNFKRKRRLKWRKGWVLLNPSQSPQMDGRPVPQTATWP